MKKTLTFALVCGFCAAIYAGPEPIPSGKEMKEVAPAPGPSCFNWAGFYLGVSGGYKRSNVDLDLRLSGGWDAGPISRDETEAAGSGNLDNGGGDLGGVIGYNFQWNCWVIGLEADGSYLWARDSDDSGILPSMQFSPHHVRNAFRTHYLTTVAPRIGYAFGRLLPYVTGGLSVGDLEFEQRIDFPGAADDEGDRQTKTNAGWMVGGGLQYALTAHWSLRGQYQYIDLGSISFRSEFFPSHPNAILAPADSRAELTEHNVSFAIMYKF